MSGPPNPYWQQTPYGMAPAESPAALDATLRALREQRGQIASSIGEQLYRMVMSGQLRDPAVIAACRPLFDMEQQITHVEATLRTYGSRGPQFLSAPSADGGGATALVPGGRPAWESGPGAGVAPHAGRHLTGTCAHCHTPLRASDQHCPVCGHPAADALSLGST